MTIQSTAKAQALIQKLKKHCPALLFYQSGGCCEGSIPICYQQDDFKIGLNDVLLGYVDGVPFYVHQSMKKNYENTIMILDVKLGNGNEFSLEYGNGEHFVLEVSVCVQTKN